MRVLIIGAAGQDGSLLAEKYSTEGHLVLGIGSSRSSSKANNVEIISIDFANSDKSRSIFESFKPDRIFHLAAVHSSSVLAEKSSERTLKKIRSCNVSITQNILDWQRSNLDSKSIIALSSKMYSYEKSGRNIDESSIFDPHSIYAKTKVEALTLIRKYRVNYGTHSSGAILFNHTSNRSKPEFLFPQLALEIAQVLSGKSTAIVVHDPDAEIDICDADEVCSGLLKMAELEAPTDIIFASGHSIKIRDLISKTMDSLSFFGEYTIERANGDFIANSGIVGNPARALRLLNWKATKSPVEILVGMINSEGK